LFAYLNSVDLGGVSNYGGNRGFESAAQYYFGKSATLLNIEEAATLVSILPAPNQREVRELRSRKYILENAQFKKIRDALINKMYDKGLITNDEKVTAEEKLLKSYVLNSAGEESLKTTAYCDHIVNDELQEILEIDGKIDKKLIVETSLDLEMQSKAETALNQTLANEGVAKGFDYGGIVTIDTKNGDILAFVGNVSPNYRQPASTFKLFTYLAALEKGKTPKDSVDCSTVQISEGRIFNCNGSDNATMSEAVAQSFNAPVIHLANSVGIKNVVEMAERLGVSLDFKDNEDPPIGVAIGEKSASLLDMTSAYATIANEGKFNKASLVTKVIIAKQCPSKEDLSSCPATYIRESSPRNVIVISADVASSMNKMLQQVVSNGTGKAASLGLGEEAGKTGTQDKNSDLWFIGYIPSKKIITGIWLGKEKGNDPTNGTSRDAAVLWRKYMKEVIN
jgi:penicillin-binding protein 1A